MATAFVNKVQAINIIMRESGYGIIVVKRTIAQLEQQRRIKFVEAPDKRAQWISRADIDFVIRYLKGEVELE